MCQSLEVTLKNGLLRPELNFQDPDGPRQIVDYPGLTYKHFLDCSAT
jgi:hypothetical protein